MRGHPLALAAITIVAHSLGCGSEAKKPPPPPPPAVFVAPVTRQDVSVYVESVATLDGYVNADIRARVKGFLKSQDYKEGEPVKKDQLLFTIEDTEYANAVSQAKANLLSRQATQQNAKATLDRVDSLAPKGIVSKQEQDNAKAGSSEAESGVLGARAALETASLNLSYTRIKAPNDGVAGLALVRVGNLVGQEGPTLLTTVSQLHPMRANFPLSELDYVKFPDRLKKLAGRDVEWAKKQFVKLDTEKKTDDGDYGLELVLADGSVFPHRGLIVTVNRQVDSSTGTIQMQALFPNADGTLRPGQYARVRIRQENVGDASLVVPEKALISQQGSFTLAVVGADNKVSLKKVETGPTVKGLTIIKSGVSEGDKIIVEGQQKVTDGAVVNPKPAPPPAAPPASAAATPKPPGSNAGP